MNKSINSIKHMLCGFVYMASGIVPAMADDTEIYFNSTGAGVTPPNVMLILDTSGSMDATDGDHIMRIDEMKEAMRSIITNSNNVNIGLMRFSNPGGPVLYPVTNIDTELPAEAGGSLSYRILDANNDGFELNAGEPSAGDVVLDNTRHEMTQGADISNVQTIEVRVDQYQDDAEEYYSSGGSWNDSRTLEMPYDGSSRRYVGFNFRNVVIPNGATIVDAEIDLVVRNSTNRLIEIDITAESQDGFSGESGSYDESNGDISGRTPTTALAEWTYDNGTEGRYDTLTTPKLTNVVQEVISGSNWASGDSMSFRFARNADSTASNELGIYSFDRDPNRAALLRVSYVVSAATANITTALRFDGVNVPRGATITGAYLDFTAVGTSSGNTSMTIRGEDTLNSAELNTTSANISTRATTTTNVEWSTTAANLTDWNTSGAVETSPDLSAIVQELTQKPYVDAGDPGWCGGNALTFIISGTAGKRVAAAAEAGSQYAPVLRINFDPDSVTAGSTCRVESINRQVVSNNDDAEESGSSTNLSSTTLDLESGNDVGLRFTNIKLPPTATVTNAYLQFTARENDSGTTSYTISGDADADGDADEFTTANNSVSGRSPTSTTVAWNVTENWSEDGTYSTPNLADVVMDIIDPSGNWASGNDMVFVIEGNSSTDRRARSFDNSPGYAPRLVIEFQDDGTFDKTWLVRDELISIVDSLGPAGSTPIQDVLYEAALYYKGMDVDYGTYRGSSPYSYTRVSHDLSMKSGTFTVNRDVACTDDNLSASACASENISGSPEYESPITLSCQQNHLVLLTDGSANSEHSTAKIKTLLGLDNGHDCEGSDSSEECVIELVRNLNEENQIDDIAGDQTITTHTIGYNLTSTWLEAVAEAGGGDYYPASSTSELEAAFESIIVTALEENATFVAPATTVNVFNRFFSRSDVFFAVFQPQVKNIWPGNLKKYQFGYATGENVAVGDSPVFDIIDNAQRLAVDDASGFFKPGAEDYWGLDTPADSDYSVVTVGGAANVNTNYANRRVYTNKNDTSVSDLSVGTNSLSSGNISGTGLTKAMFGANSYTDGEFIALVDWARGRDNRVDGGGIPVDMELNSSTDTRYYFGDPLHSRPVAITYGPGAFDSNGDGVVDLDDAPDMVTYVATNAGFLHAVNARTGGEEFAFIPGNLLPKVREAYEDATTDLIYGLDGPVVPYVIDNNGDGVISEVDGDRAILYVGQRRGGRNYYAVDVTSRSQSATDATLLADVVTAETALTAAQTHYDEFGDLATANTAVSDAATAVTEASEDLLDANAFYASAQMDADSAETTRVAAVAAAAAAASTEASTRALVTPALDTVDTATLGTPDTADLVAGVIASANTASTNLTNAEAQLAAAIALPESAAVIAAYQTKRDTAEAYRDATAAMRATVQGTQSESSDAADAAAAAVQAMNDGGASVSVQAAVADTLATATQAQVNSFSAVGHSANVLAAIQAYRTALADANLSTPVAESDAAADLETDAGNAQAWAGAEDTVVDDYVADAQAAVNAVNTWDTAVDDKAIADATVVSTTATATSTATFAYAALNVAITASDDATAAAVAHTAAQQALTDAIAAAGQSTVDQIELDAALAAVVAAQSDVDAALAAAAASDGLHDSDPAFLWQITGGSGDFTELGETWSTPVLTRVNINGVEKVVLIFAGGYDANQDDTEVRATDGMGRAIYIVDALTGARLWSAGSSGATQTYVDMDYSFPSSLSVLDINQDGLADQMYIGDTGGQIWRFDINHGNTAATLTTGGVIADLGGAAAADNRRFYQSVDLFLEEDATGLYLGLAVGSGYRAHPLNTATQDRFFLIKQRDVLSAPSTYTKLTAANLYNATDNVLGTGTDEEKETATTALGSAQGWYFDMPNSGEKVLSTPLVLSSQIFFATYEPKSTGAGCNTDFGVNRAYTLNVADATAVDAERSRTITSSSFVDEPTFMIIDPGYDMVRTDSGYDIDEDGDGYGDESGDSMPGGSDGTKVCFSMDCGDAPLDKTLILRKTYWYQQ